MVMTQQGSVSNINGEGKIIETFLSVTQYTSVAPQTAASKKTTLLNQHLFKTGSIKTNMAFTLGGFVAGLLY